MDEQRYNYFLPRLNLKEQEILRSYAIPFGTYSFPDENTPGVLIAPNKLNAVQFALGLTVTTIERIDRNPDIRVVHFERSTVPVPEDPVSTPITVIREVSDPKAWRSFLAGKSTELVVNPKKLLPVEQAVLRVIVERLIPQARREVVVVLRSTVALDPPRDERLVLFLNGGLRDAKPATRPKELWNEPLSEPSAEDTNCAPTSSDGIIRDFRQTPVAQRIEGNSIYLLHALRADRFEDHLILAHLCEEIGLALIEDDELRRIKKGERHRARNLEARELFVTGTLKQLTGRAEALKSELTKAQQTAEDLLQKYIAAERKAQTLRMELTGVTGVSHEAVVKREELFAELMGMPKIASVEAHKGVLRIYTEVLFCDEPINQADPGAPRRRWEMGAFRIDVGITSHQGELQFFNLTRRVRGAHDNMHHPHISDGGLPCWGNKQETFATLLARWEISALVSHAIMFIESVNIEDSYGKYVTRWPEVTPATTLQATL